MGWQSSLRLVEKRNVPSLFLIWKWLWESLMYIKLPLSHDGSQDLGGYILRKGPERGSLENGKYKCFLIFGIKIAFSYFSLDHSLLWYIKEVSLIMLFPQYTRGANDKGNNQTQYCWIAKALESSYLVSNPWNTAF